MKQNLIYLMGIFLMLSSAIHAQTTGLRFDGVNDYAVVPHNSAYDIGYGNFTIEAWVNLDVTQTAPTYPALVSTRSNSSNGFMLFFFQGQLSLQTQGSNHDSSPNGDIRDGKCHHVAVVRSSTSLISWYIDGQLTTTNIAANYDITSSGPLVIGNDFAGSPSYPLKGSIQEVRIWNVARTQSQIQTSMNAQLSGTETGLIGYWRLDDNSGQTIVDHSSLNNNGTLGSTASSDVNDPAFAPACPIVTPNQTTGLRFDGVNDYAVVPHSSAYDIGYGNFTIEAWVNLDVTQTAPTYPALVSTRSNSSNGFMLFFFQGQLSLQTQGSNHDSSPNGDIRDGKCHHVAVVRSSTSLISWYIDGQLTTTNIAANYDITSSGPLVIGNDFAGSPSYPLKGSIQEVRIWNVARTQSQIQTSMNAQLSGTETGLIGYWRLDDNSGQTIVDHSSLNNNGTLGSTPSSDVNDPAFMAACPLGSLNGIDDISAEGNYNLVIYPNPMTSSSILKINALLNNAEVIIYDMLGKEMMRKKMNGNSMEIEKGNLESGIYFVRVSDNEKQYVQKIVVE